MSRLKKQERQKQLQEKLNITPFLTDEELATHFNVSVPTIRLDRLELGIPELRERIRVMATGQSQEAVEHVPYEVVGELIDVTEGQQALSMLRTTSDMEFICSSKFPRKGSHGDYCLFCGGWKYKI